MQDTNSQTCKWIPNGLFTYITLAGAPLQARLHQPIRCPSILLLPDSWCNDSVQRTLHLCWRPAPAQCGAGAAEASPATTTRGQKGGTQGKNRDIWGNGQKRRQGLFLVIPPFPIAMVTKERLCCPWCWLLSVDDVMHQAQQLPASGKVTLPAERTNSFQCERYGQSKCKLAKYSSAAASPAPCFHHPGARPLCFLLC